MLDLIICAFISFLLGSAATIFLILLVGAGDKGNERNKT